MEDQAQLVLFSIHQAQRSTSRIEKLIRTALDDLEVRYAAVSSPASTYTSLSGVNLGSPDTLETKVEEESKDIENDQLNLDFSISTPWSATTTHDISPLFSPLMPQLLQDQVNGHVNGDAVDVVAAPKASFNKAAHPDPDAQAMVIDSLRSQVQDLFSQVSQLNNKLVQSYDRVSDLEDQLHEASNGIRTSSLKISQLELERTQHMSALNSGLLVERTHVTTELTRLMEKATEEAARRGQAESARAEIEQELDDLSAGLFGQANTMVAEARLGKAKSERKVEETERSLKSAEEAIADMQLHMQALESEKEEAQRQLDDIRITMGKGKWIQRPAHPEVEASKRLLSCHAQYRDFLYFVSYLREQRQKLPQIPAMNLLLSHSFLSRLQTEDSDPTVRLDLAPSLNWLTRKSVLSAIHQGQLDIEPLPSETLIQELSSAQSIIPGLNTGSHISCALCGVFILSDPSSHHTTKPPSHPLSRPSNGTSYSGWSSSLLKNPLVNSIAGSVLSTPSHSPTRSSFVPSHVYIFRLAADATKMLQSPAQGRNPSTMYPLCSSGWCLTRLRAACTLWAFVRTSVVEKVWEETPTLRRSRSSEIKNGHSDPGKHEGVVGDRPPILPPRRSKIGMFWERAASLGKGDVDKVAEKEKNSEVEPPRRLPPPLPSHLALAAPKPRTVPPPLPARRRSRVPTSSAGAQALSGEDHSPAKVNGAEDKTPHSDDEKQTTPFREDQGVTTEAPTSISRTSPVAVPRPQSPWAIPLPDSAPGTPTFSPIHTEIKIDLPGVPNGPDTPPRTSSPAPPPLPRRAAARTRPLSTIDHKRTSSLTHEVPLEKLVQEPIDEKPADDPKSVEDSTSVVAGATATLQEEKTEDVSEPNPLVDEKAEDPLPVPSIENGTESAAKIHHSADIVADEDNNSPVCEQEKAIEEITINGIALSVISDQDLVGDSSWEEKTWKELVKLREDMFWARIGGLR